VESDFATSAVGRAVDREYTARAGNSSTENKRGIFQGLYSAPDSIYTVMQWPPSNYVRRLSVALDLRRFSPGNLQVKHGYDGIRDLDEPKSLPRCVESPITRQEITVIRKCFGPQARSTPI
jgi:hypothetical protein